ncbi:MAG TPA: hypothetical protein PK771_04800, partial [Spirochaetota bacterium]|nr:hypothetical protein [Spirochaetota bacterium]
MQKILSMSVILSILTVSFILAGCDVKPAETTTTVAPTTIAQNTTIPNNVTTTLNGVTTTIKNGTSTTLATFNIGTAYYTAWSKSVADIAVKMANDPILGQGTKTWSITGTYGGTMSFTQSISMDGMTVKYSMSYTWNNLKSEDGLILNGSYNYNYNSSTGGTLTGNITLSGAGSGTVTYNCTVTAQGVITGDYTINGVKYNYTTGVVISGGVTTT